MAEQIVNIRYSQSQPKGVEYAKRVIGSNEYQYASEIGEAHKLIGPNNVLMQINYGCYLRCQMCDRWEWTRTGADRSTEMDGLELDRVFDDLATAGAKKVTLVGTEPVIRSDLPEILYAIRERGMKPEVYNSGIRMPVKVVEAILSNSADVAFSIDGFFPESHNSIRWPSGNRNVFGQTTETIKRLRSARESAGLGPGHVRITANMTLQDKNIDDLPRTTGENVDQFGVDMLRISLAHGIQDDGSVDAYCLDERHMSALKDFYTRFQTGTGQTRVAFSAGIRYVSEGLITPEDFNRNILIPSDVASGESGVKCTIAEWSTMIDPEGNVYPCLYLLGDNSPYDDATRHKFNMGNLREASFGDIWNGDRYQEFRESHFPLIEDGSRCLTCEYVDRFSEMNDVANGTQRNAPDLTIGW